MHSHAFFDIGSKDKWMIIWVCGKYTDDDNDDDYDAGCFQF